MNEAVRKGFKAAALPDRGDVGVRALVRGLSVEPATDRKDDGRARGGRRSRHDPSVVDQDAAGACRGVSSARAPSGHELAYGRTYVKVSGEWKYLYRAVDRTGHTVDFLLCAHRNLAAARCFFERAIDLHGVPEKITIDKSGANTAAIVGLCTDSGVDIEMRQSKYLNILIEQDHRAIRRVVRPMLGFKSFHCARAIIAGIETMHMIKKRQLDFVKDRTSSVADKFYSLAF